MSQFTKSQTPVQMSHTPSRSTATGATGAAVAQRPSRLEQFRPAPPSSREERFRLICDAAYYLAENDGFQTGKEVDYWLQAEQKIDALGHRASPATADQTHGDAMAGRL